MFHKNHNSKITFLRTSLDEDTSRQIKVFPRFLLKFLRFKYYLICVQQDQSANFNFPQTLDETDLLPFFIDNKFTHPHYIIPLELLNTCFDTILFDDHFVVEQSETSDVQPHVSTNVTLNSHTLLDDHNTHLNDQNELFIQSS